MMRARRDIVTEPEIHHIGHPFRDNMTYCGIPMPPEQLEVRPRGQVEICPECAKHFKQERATAPAVEDG